MSYVVQMKENSKAYKALVSETVDYHPSSQVQTSHIYSLLAGPMYELPTLSTSTAC